jgi:hypothetical protein
MRRWLTAEQFSKSNLGGSVLPTIGSVKWAVRCAAPALVEAGVLVPSAGRRPMLIRVDAADVYADILSAAARGSRCDAEPPRSPLDAAATAPGVSAPDSAAASLRPPSTV